MSNVEHAVEETLKVAKGIAMKILCNGNERDVLIEDIFKVYNLIVDERRQQYKNEQVEKIVEYSLPLLASAFVRPQTH